MSVASSTEGYTCLKERLDQIDKDLGIPCNRLFYLAIPPEQYEVVIEHIGGAGLAQPTPGCGMWTRIIVEKPFGYDLETSRHLNDALLRFFSEDEFIVWITIWVRRPSRTSWYFALPTGCSTTLEPQVRR